MHKLQVIWQLDPSWDIVFSFHFTFSHLLPKFCMTKTYSIPLPCPCSLSLDLSRDLSVAQSQATSQVDPLPNDWDYKQELLWFLFRWVLYVSLGLFWWCLFLNSCSLSKTNNTQIHELFFALILLLRKNRQYIRWHSQYFDSLSNYNINIW